MDITSYLEQHKEAARLIGELEGKLSNPVEEAEAIKQILTTLIGKLNFHISMEDKFIYPKAVESTEESLKTTTTKMQVEMAPLGDALGEYAKKWLNVNGIKSDADTFVVETKVVIAALKSRIEAEERDFYPLVKEYM